MSIIKDNLDKINANITRAASLSGRTREDITLVAVTKTRSADEINEAIDSGVGQIGENRVQELCDKIDAVRDNTILHFIGQLQTNKVKYIIDKINLIQSLDRLELAAEINKRAQRLERKIPVLIEVNIGDEATKAGLDPEMVKGFIESLSAYPNIVVQGLMTVAPYCEDKEEVRGYFRRMKQLFDSMAGVGREDFEMKYLSMGMSNDYEIAIEEGSNMVRLGTVLFGKRI